MTGDDDRGRPPRRTSLKSHFTNHPSLKDKLRENCYKRVQDDRTRLLWKMRLSDTKNHSLNDEDFIKSTLQNIVSDELKKIEESSSRDCSGTYISSPEASDPLWEYDGLHEAYGGECEKMLLEMQRIFYEDLKTEQIGKEPDRNVKTWEDEEDEYLARAVFENMQLHDGKVEKEVWCPICKQGKLKENALVIYCTLCELNLNRTDQVSLDLLWDSLAEAHADHFNSGCKLKPRFCVKCKFGLTALYMKCQGCRAFEVVM